MIETAIQEAIDQTTASHLAVHRAVRDEIYEAIHKLETEKYAGALASLQACDAGLARIVGPTGPDQ